jgi:hypothetical protein
MLPQDVNAAETCAADGGSASAVLLVRPAAFGPNVETAATNAFQHADGLADRSDVLHRARQESDALAHALESKGVDVCVLEDVSPPARPDACFPNNWVSLHPDGRMVVYPLLAPNRRLERRVGELLDLVRRRGYSVTDTLDLTAWESKGVFLEGTGSMVLDHRARVAFAALSPRTCLEPLEDFCRRLGYRAVAFVALDPRGLPVYHTNVLMSLGPDLAVLCADSIPDTVERARVQTTLRDTGRAVLTIDVEQMCAFAGNVLWLKSIRGEPLLVLSSTAAGRLRRSQLAALERVAELVVVTVDTIEWFGGGSVRCMLAEIHLPRSPAC